MFLNVISKRNPKLIESCVNLHQEGIIPPNTYVVDVDSVIKMLVCWLINLEIMVCLSIL